MNATLRGSGWTSQVSSTVFGMRGARGFGEPRLDIDTINAKVQEIK